MFDKPQRYRLLVRSLVIGCLLILLLLIAFEATPLFSGSFQQLLSLSTAQQWVVERIAKNAWAMEHGTSDQRADALNELQNMLPYWQQNQKTLQNSPQPWDVQILMVSANVDYTDIAKAAQVLIAHPQSPADPVEVKIILDHERPYFLNMNQIVTILRQRLDLGTRWLFGIEATLCSMLFGSGVLFLIITERRMGRIVRQERRLAQQGSAPIVLPTHPET